MSEPLLKHISVEAFDALDPDTVTVVDVREPEERVFGEVEGALLLPLSAGFAQYDTVPKDKPVIVLCKIGRYSEVVAEILADRGYDAASLKGGYNSYLGWLQGY